MKHLTGRILFSILLFAATACSLQAGGDDRFGL
jgi:hypothetical protein